MIRKAVSSLLLTVTVICAETLPLSFKGNDNISDRSLYEALGFHKPYPYEFWSDDPATEADSVPLLAETLKNYYKSRGYYHVVVRSQVNEKSVLLEIEEKNPILVADVSTISPLDIRKKIPFTPGDAFDTQRFSQSKNDIRTLYADKSYCNMQLYARAWIDIETDSAYLLYDVTPGERCKFGPVDIHSSEQIEPGIIASLLYFKEGDPYSPESIRLSYDSLYAQEGIAKAIIDSSKKKGNTVLTDVSVTDFQKPVRLKTGLGYSSDERFMALLGVTHRNLFGNLRRSDFEIRYTEIRQTAKVNFDMPLTNHNAAGFEVGYENELYNGFKERRTFETLFIAQSRLPHKFKESLLFDQTVIYDSDDIGLFPEENLYLISPKIQWSYDVRDKILDPSRGFMLSAEAQGSVKSPVSDASYYRYLVSGATILPVKPSILALRARYGSLRIYEGRVPPSYRFYAGGMNSNRAYAYRKLGPTNANGDPTGFDSVLTATTEYRFPVSGDFRGVLFNDTTFIGDSFIPDYDKGYFAVGIGIRYLTPIGPLALDVGVDVEDTSQFTFHFHVGELF